MKKNVVVTPLLAAVLLATSAISLAAKGENLPPTQAAQPMDSLQSFLLSMRLKLERLMPQNHLTATTAVGGVRGAQVGADDVYWKGAAGVDAQQVLEFNAAMANIQDGHFESAKLRIRSFLREHPESPLSTDAEEALKLLSTR